MSLTLSQIEVSNTDGWWWSTLTSRPAMLLLLLGAGCLFLMVYLGWRMRKTATQQNTQRLRERLASDSGVAMVEFALVTPILLFLTLLLLQTMLVFTGLFYVQYAAFAAARSAIVQIPMQSTEPINQIQTDRRSEKFSAIESSAILAVMPISGREGESVVAGGGGSTLVQGVTQLYSVQGREVPPWVDGMLAQRLNYAANHTTVELETVRPGDGLESVVYDPIAGLAEVSPKEAISVRVQHQFALTIPIASRVFASVGISGSYSPVSRNNSSPAAPGQWTLIQSRAVLTNEGIDRRLPPEPSVPRF